MSDYLNGFGEDENIEVDNLFGSKKRKAAKQAAAQSTIMKLSETQKLSPASIQAAIFGSDGKLTRRERKTVQQAVRQENKTLRKTSGKDSETKQPENLPVPPLSQTSEMSSITPAQMIPTEDVQKMQPDNVGSLGSSVGSMAEGLSTTDPLSDEPTGNLADVKTLETAVIPNKKKNKMFLYIGLAVLAVVLVLYFVKSKK